MILHDTYSPNFSFINAFLSAKDSKISGRESIMFFSIQRCFPLLFIVNRKWICTPPK